MDDVDNIIKNTFDDVHAVIEAAFEQACRAWDEELDRRKATKVFHSPPPRDAVPKKSILKKPRIGVVFQRRNSPLALPPTLLADESVDAESPKTMSVDEAQALVTKQCALGRWYKKAAWSYNAITAKFNWFEFVVDGKSKTFDFKDELCLAGYDTWAGRDEEWHTAAGDAIGRSGFGKEITDLARLEVLHEQHDFFTAKRTNDGFIYAGKLYTKAKFPDACVWGPHGGIGAKWGSNFTGD